MLNLDIAIWIATGMAIFGILGLFVLLFLMERDGRRHLALMAALIERLGQRMDKLERALETALAMLADRQLEELAEQEMYDAYDEA
jgi:hypothetical protein